VFSSSHRTLLFLKTYFLFIFIFRLSPRPPDNSWSPEADSTVLSKQRRFVSPQKQQQPQPQPSSSLPTMPYFAKAKNSFERPPPPTASSRTNQISPTKSRESSNPNRSVSSPVKSPAWKKSTNSNSPEKSTTKSPVSHSLASNNNNSLRRAPAFEVESDEDENAFPTVYNAGGSSPNPYGALLSVTHSLSLSLRCLLYTWQLIIEFTK
jgi:hypothetical protein